MGTIYSKGDTIRHKNGTVARIAQVKPHYVMNNGETWPSSDVANILMSCDDEKLAQSLCDKLSTTLDAMRAKCRKSEVIIKRQAIMYAMSVKYGCPQERIGRTLERNHSTVHNSIVRFDTLLELHYREYVQAWELLNNDNKK